MGVPQDPAVMASIPRLQLAQSLMQNSVSDAPTGPAGALGRLGQAIVGNILFNRANSGIQDILNQRAQQAGQASSWIMGGGDPMGASAPTSPNTPPAPTPVSFSTPSPGNAPISTFATQLASSESGGNPAAMEQHGLGYSGLYQFGAGRLADNGLYQPAPGENLKANEWKGTFNIPGFPNVKTQQDFLANPTAQNAALGVDLQNTDKAIANTPGAGAFDQNGLRAVAHLGGVQGMRDFVASGGQANPQDPNHTSLMDYYTKFSGNGPPAPQNSGAPAAQNDINPFEIARRATAVLTNPNMMYNQQAQRAAMAALEYAKIRMQNPMYSVGANGIQTNTVTHQQTSAATARPNYVTGPGGIQIETNTNKQESAASPLPNYQQTPTGAVDVTGTHPPVFARPDLATNLTLSILGSKDPATLTPQERILLDAAHENYQNYKVGTDPATGGLIRYAERPPLPGLAVPGGAPGSPTPITPPAAPPPQAGGFAPLTPNPAAPTVAPQGNNVPLQPGGPPVPRGPDGLPAGPPLAGPRIPQGGAAMSPQVTPPMPEVTPLTPSARGPQAAQEIVTNQAKKDSDEISAEQAAVMKGHSALGATAAIRAELPNVTTGPGADARLTLSRFGAMLGIPDNDLKSIIGTNPVSGELLQKKLFEIQTHALRLMGAREPGSVLQAYQKNFPNMASQPGTADSMTRMLDMDQVYGEDEINGRQGYFQNQVANVAANKPYGGMGGYQQPDPRVYVSAALASGGRPFSEWSHGLTPYQQAEALRLAARVYPDATALDANGVRNQFQRPQQPMPGGGGG